MTPLADILDILMFAALCALLLSGYPVAFTLAGTALVFAGLGHLLGVFDLGFLSAFPSRVYGTMINETLIAVPLFVFMGVMLERSKVAEELLESMGRLFGPLRGGLGISVFAVGALLAASTGIVGATVVTMGLLSLPTMLRRGYDPAFASGAICASGTLGQIIPPSIVLVLLGDVMSSAYQAAQLRMGNFSPETVSVGDLFAGALIPGLVLVGFYILYQIVLAIVRPASSPAIPAGEIGERYGQVVRKALAALLPPVTLIIAVLGSILSGIATPTEAASFGAVGALLLAGSRQASGATGILAARWPAAMAAAALVATLVLLQFFDLRVGRAVAGAADVGAIYAGMALLTLAGTGILICLYQVYRSGVLRPVMNSTARITAMVFMILIGAAMFSLVFRGLGGDVTIENFLTGLPGGATGAMMTVMAVMFLLGFFLDFIEITYVIVPVVAPVLLQMGFDPVWLGVMIAVNLQTSFLTPPFGFALFYLRGVAPPEVRTHDIYRGVVPFVLIQLGMLGVLALWPRLATWLPAAMGQ